MENIIEKLKRLSDIQPDANYSQRSKLTILATPLPQKERLINVIEKLKRLREIQPEAEYFRLSKMAVLAIPVSPRKRLFFNWQLAFTVAGLLLVLISGGLFRYLKPSAPNLNAQALKTELQNLDINIQLAKIEYYQKVDEAVSLALKEISENHTNQLNPIILESENEEIKNLLDQLLL
jgi:hypothetical protein